MLLILKPMDSQKNRMAYFQCGPLLSQDFGTRETVIEIPLLNITEGMYSL